MHRHILIITIIIAYSGWSQDYSRKPFASVHQYAERVLGSQIKESKEEVDLRKDVLYYYAEKDLPGNYVHVSGGYTGDYFVALWKMKNGNDLVGVTHYNCQVYCVYECSFFEFTQNDSTEISAEILPVKKMVKHLTKIKSKVVGAAGNMDDEEAQFKFILPHGSGYLGLEISMNRNKVEFPIMQLEWTGEKFAIRTKYKEIPDL